MCTAGRMRGGGDARGGREREVEGEGEREREKEGRGRNEMDASLLYYFC